jgi:hypothetical protein
VHLFRRDTPPSRNVSTMYTDFERSQVCILGVQDYGEYVCQCVLRKCRIAIKIVWNFSHDANYDCRRNYRRVHTFKTREHTLKFFFFVTRVLCFAAYCRRSRYTINEKCKTNNFCDANNRERIMACLRFLIGYACANVRKPSVRLCLNTKQCF